MILTLFIASLALIEEKRPSSFMTREWDQVLHHHSLYERGRKVVNKRNCQQKERESLCTGRRHSRWDMIFSFSSKVLEEVRVGKENTMNVRNRKRGGGKEQKPRNDDRHDQLSFESWVFDDEQHHSFSVIWSYAEFLSSWDATVFSCVISIL